MSLGSSRRRLSLRRPRAPVVYACDAGYFEGFVTSLASLRASDPRRRVVLGDVGLLPDQRRWCTDHHVAVGDLRFILDLDVQLPGWQHINLAALASLYVHRIVDGPFIFVDVDVILLASLANVEAALGRAQIVGVLGNAVGSIDDGYVHTLARELEDSTGAELVARFPKLDLAAPAINSGLFGARAELFRRWERRYRELFPYLSGLKMGDQTIINVLRALHHPDELFLGPENNFTGLRLARSLGRNPADLQLRVDRNRTPVVMYRDRELRAFHFTGKVKPWRRSDRIDQPQLLWRFFDPNDDSVTIATIDRQWRKASRTP